MANHRRMTRLRRTALLAVGACVPVSWLLAGSAVAVPMVDPAALPVIDAGTAGPTTVVVSDVAEGWYAPAVIDLCTTPLGCPPMLLPSLYPANTLHAGVALGLETARTYLKPNLASVPPGSTIVKATMTLPVASGTTDGTISPDAASLIACPATQPFDDGAAGSLKTPPKAGCNGAASLKYDATHEVFTVDLTKTVARWSKGSAEDGVAVMADSSKTSLTTLWHVAFNGRKLAGAPHITTSITFTPSVAATPTATPTESTSPAPVAVVPTEPALPLPDDGSTEVQPPPVVAPSVAPAAEPVALSRGFKYPMAFLFPIALLAMGVFLTRLFTRDATPMRRR